MFSEERGDRSRTKVWSISHDNYRVSSLESLQSRLIPENLNEGLIYNMAEKNKYRK